MNTDHYIRLNDYIVLHRNEEGDYKPLCFSDGTLVIYGNEAEAKDDAGKDGIVAEIFIPKTA